MSRNDEIWHSIDNVVDADTEDWRALAIVGGVAPRYLENVIRTFEDKELQQQMHKSLQNYKNEVVGIIMKLEDLPEDRLSALKTSVVGTIWKLPVQPEKLLFNTVQELVRQNCPPTPIPA